jgi:hypothetical protein
MVFLCHKTKEFLQKCQKHIFLQFFVNICPKLEAKIVPETFWLKSKFKKLKFWILNGNLTFARDSISSPFSVFPLIVRNAIAAVEHQNVWQPCHLNFKKIHLATSLPEFFLKSIWQPRYLIFFKNPFDNLAS